MARRAMERRITPSANPPYESDACARNDRPRRSPLLVGPFRRLELLAELVEFVGADVADRPVVQAAVAPAADVEALDGSIFAGFRAGFEVCATNRLMTWARRL